MSTHQARFVWRVDVETCGYCTQFDRTVKVLSGCLGSLVGKCTLKLCLPPMSPCIRNCIDNVVVWPGLRTIAPMVGVGGQHPSTTWTYGVFLKINI